MGWKVEAVGLRELVLVVGSMVESACGAIIVCVE